MHISDICTRDVVTCTPQASASEMARLMRQHHVGDLIVVDEAGGQRVPVGVVTDRDLVVQVLAKGIDAELVVAGDIMSDRPVTALASESIFDAVWHMRGKCVRRLPVVDARGALVGVLTADDINRFLARELNDVAQIAPRQIQQEQARIVAA